MKKFYIDGPFGQIHCIEWGSDTTRAPILCLSPSPFSSKAYLTMAPILAEQRRVIAVDYPGFGNSDPKHSELSIGDLAQVVMTVTEHYSPDCPVDVFGFHTGTLVATEMSLLSPESVNRLVLTDIPFFTPAKQAELLTSMPAVVELDSEFSSLEATWKFCVESKLEHMPLSRAFQMFVDHISAAEGGNAVFRAAFNYPCQRRFEQVVKPTWVIATGSSLYHATCKAAKSISTANLIEFPDIKAAVLETGARRVSEAVLDVLNTDAS